jgi:hypothetical protein
MYVCMHACMCVCMCVCMYACMCVCPLSLVCWIAPVIESTACLPDNYLPIHVPVGYLHCINNPRTDWLFKTEPESGLHGRVLAYTRGKVAGGCSSINGMIYMRGQSADWDHWAVRFFSEPLQLGDLVGHTKRKLIFDFLAARVFVVVCFVVVSVITASGASRRIRVRAVVTYAVQHPPVHLAVLMFCAGPYRRTRLELEPHVAAFHAS